MSIKRILTVDTGEQVNRDPNTYVLQHLTRWQNIASLFLTTVIAKWKKADNVYQVTRLREANFDNAIVKELIDDLDMIVVVPSITKGCNIYSKFVLEYLPNPIPERNKDLRIIFSYEWFDGEESDISVNAAKDLLKNLGFEKKLKILVISIELLKVKKYIFLKERSLNYDARVNCNKYFVNWWF